MNDEEKNIIKEYLDYIKKDKNIKPFLLPVDYEGLGLTDYPTIIQKPMDISTISKNLDNNIYKSIDEVKADIQLIWDNCRKYNLDGSAIFKSANNCEKTTKKFFNKHNNKLNNNINNNKEINNNINENNNNNNNDKNNNANNPNHNIENINKNNNTNNKEIPLNEESTYHETQNSKNETEKLDKNDDTPNGLTGQEKVNLSNRIKKLQNDGLASLVRLVQKECPISIHENEDNIEITLSQLDRKTFENINKLIDTFLKVKETNAENLENKKNNINNMTTPISNKI